MEPPGDQNQWIVCSQRGDRAAFEQLMRQHARLVYARLALLTRDRDLADDLTQETFLRAWRSIGQLTENDAFPTWLQTIAQRVFLDHQKMRRRRVQATPMLECDDPPDSAPTNGSPIERAEQSEQQQRLIDAIAKLPDAYRNVLSLRYLGGADYAAIGHQLSLSNGALRGLLSRGLKLLREMLSECEVRP